MLAGVTLADLINGHHQAMLDDPHPDGTAMHAKMLALLTARQAKQHASGAQAGSVPSRPQTPDAGGVPTELLALLSPPGPRLTPDGGQDSISLASLLSRQPAQMDYAMPVTLAGMLGRG